jgi:hypothetical protein
MAAGASFTALRVRVMVGAIYHLIHVSKLLASNQNVQHDHIASQHNVSGKNGYLPNIMDIVDVSSIFWYNNVYHG